MSSSRGVKDSLRGATTFVSRVSVCKNPPRVATNFPAHVRFRATPAAPVGSILVMLDKIVSTTRSKEYKHRGFKAVSLSHTPTHKRSLQQLQRKHHTRVLCVTFQTYHHVCPTHTRTHTHTFVSRDTGQGDMFRQCQNRVFDTVHRFDSPTVQRGMLGQCMNGVYATACCLLARSLKKFLCVPRRADNK